MKYSVNVTRTKKSTLCPEYHVILHAPEYYMQGFITK